MLFLFRDDPRVAAVQRGAIDGVAFATSLMLAPVDAWDRLGNVFQTRSSLQEEVLRLQQELGVLLLAPGRQLRREGRLKILKRAKGGTTITPCRTMLFR